MKVPLNIGALQQACTHLVERHESLRTVFLEKEGTVYQRILPACEFRVMVHQCDDLDEERLQTLIAQNERFSFDLQAGPLLNIALHHCLKTDRHILLFNTHHMISDGWSLANFVKELASMLSAYYCHDQHCPDDQPLRLQFKDYVVWQHQQMQSETGQASKQWWLQHLQFTITSA
ncbi:condensation domain-containing protein [Vibrio sp. PP-XX7]